MTSLHNFGILGVTSGVSILSFALRGGYQYAIYLHYYESLYTFSIAKFSTQTPTAMRKRGIEVNLHV